MSRQSKQIYTFDDFRLDPAEGLLWRGGDMVPLTQRAFDLLLALVERQGQVVSKEELMRQVWAGNFVEEGNLTQNIYTLRKALGKAADGDDYIRTVPRRGYRFAVSVSDDQNGEHTTSQEGDEGGIRQSEFADTIAAEMTVANVASESVPEETAAASAVVFAGHRRRDLLLLATVAAVLFGVGFWIYSASRPDGPGAGAGGQMTVTSLTTTGNLQCVAISPDGKYVAYAAAERQQAHSLWLMQLATLSTRQLIPPIEGRYYSIRFSPDGAYLYYVKLAKGDTLRTLYRVPMLGGAEKRLIESVNSAVAFSPDGRRLAFRRTRDDRRETVLVIADAEGGNEREIGALPYPETFQDPAWSPDGKTIACGVGRSDGGLNMYVVTVNVEDGSRRPVSGQRWRWIGQMAWLPDASGLMMVASDTPAAPYQIWRLNWRGDGATEAAKVTNDANFYNRMNMSADGGAIVAMHRKQITNLWLLPREDAGRAKQLTYGAGGVRGGLSWLPDGRILLDSTLGSASTISVVNADGSDPRQLTGDRAGQGIPVSATGSPDGRYIVYSSDNTGKRHIWRMNVDGSNPVPLTSGEGEDLPTVSPDGRWVVYTRIGADRPSLWRVSIDGGESTRITEAIASHPSFSPDGKQLACFYAESLADPTMRLAVIPVDGGPPVKIFPNRIEGSTLLQWMPDGKALSYAENLAGVSKIWIQPLAGGEPQPFAEFESDRIFGFSWSLDGKHLACVRGFWSSDAVLIKLV